MTRIMWVSNAMHSNTGYGIQSRLFVPRIKKLGYEMAVFGFYGVEGSLMNFNGIPCYPKAVHPYGQDVVRAHAQHFQADYILTLMDTWVIQPMNMQPVPWVAYYPVDHDPMPPKVKESIMHANYRIAMSKFGVKATQEMGMSCGYVPHAVDTNLYKMIDKTEARERMKFPKDAYIVGTVAMNKGIPSRKCFPQMLEAFRNFKRRHTSAVYLLHSQMGTGQDGLGGVNLPEMCSLLGLQVGKDVFFSDQYMMMLGFNEEYMSLLYSSFDVMLLTSAGEGFGVPLIEAQACGCPVITGGWTAMPELVRSGHIIDKKDADKSWTGIASYNYLPRIKAIENALELEYKKPSPRERARKAMVEEYDVEVVMEKNWKPVLEDIDKELARTRERWAKMQELRAEAAND